VITLIIAAPSCSTSRSPRKACRRHWRCGSTATSQLEFLLLVNGVFLVLGCFLDVSVMLLVFVPMLLPAAKLLGIDLVHFGVVVVVNMMIGLVTPPFGMLLFVTNALTGIPIRDMIREGWLTWLLPTWNFQ
jgi:TRAP-type C4-dicarboxylate transport system permease large subunit